jgi:hypothetical protein
VPKRRLELLQAYAHQTLNLARLPIPPLRHRLYLYICRLRCQAEPFTVWCETNSRQSFHRDVSRTDPSSVRIVGVVVPLLGICLNISPNGIERPFVANDMFVIIALPETLVKASLYFVYFFWTRPS